MKLNKEYRKDCKNSEVLWFFENILAAINPAVTNFRSKKYKEPISQIFSVSDEAYALLIVENEYERWKDQIKAGKDGKKSFMRKKYVDYKSGKKGDSSWSLRGRKLFTYLCKTVDELRKSDETGKQFEENLMKHYRKEMDIEGNTVTENIECGRSDEMEDNDQYEDPEFISFIGV